jgi:3-phenylpropionate/trans-cinnamate dioxygenase ferredoxin reductase subunit
MPASETCIIVGAGMAGGKAALTLREEGFDGRVLLIGEEPDPPYERPPLSKEYLRGEVDRGAFAVADADDYAEEGIELLLGRRAERVEPGERAVVLDGGERLRYDRLLLATGAEPRRLPIPGAELDGVLLLRTVADSEALRGRLAASPRLVVIGAGWIGSEVAASARQMGAAVTVVEPRAVPLQHVVGEQVGAVFADLHREHGVEMLLGEGVEAIEGAGRVERVRTAGGRVLDCDLVLVGVGASPRTAPAEDAGLAVDNGILVDEHLRTSAPDVFAAGDVANAHHPLYGRRIRVEHWANALEQGPAAARSMLGSQQPYDKLPFFFSDQYDTGLEYRGFATEWDRVVVRGDLGGREAIVFWVADGRVVAAMNLNVWDVGEPIERLLRARPVIDDRKLADPDVELGALVAGADR